MLEAKSSFLNNPDVFLILKDYAVTKSALFYTLIRKRRLEIVHGTIEASVVMVSQLNILYYKASYTSLQYCLEYP